jgi:hypothetical protein
MAPLSTRSITVVTVHSGSAAIADVVAKQDSRRCPALARLRETGGERFAIGMNIGEDRNPH